jgi:hypothetical protein
LWSAAGFYAPDSTQAKDWLIPEHDIQYRMTPKLATAGTQRWIATVKVLLNI